MVLGAASAFLGVFARIVLSRRFGLLVLPAFFLLGLGFSCYSAFTRLQIDMSAADRKQAALSLAQDFLSCLKDAETGQRGYLLTGKESYLDPYRRALDQLSRLHNRLLQQAGSENESQDLLRQIETYSNEKLAELGAPLRLRREAGPAAALAVVTTDRGERAMQEIRVVIGQLSQSEQRALSQALLSCRRNQAALRNLMVGGGLALTCLLLSCALALARDSEKHQAMVAALREGEEHYRYFVELNLQIPWTVSPQGEIVELSEKWCRLTGLQRQDVISGRWLQYLHPDDQATVAEAWRVSMQTGVPLDCEHRQKVADGSYRWMRTRAYPRRNQRGEIVKWYGTSDDIQARKLAEEELRQAKATLEQTVQERTIQLKNTNQELELANKELDTFAYTASHDLRAPLRNIDVLGRILGEDFGPELSASAMDYIRRIRAASQRMGRLINDLLAFSRLNREEAYASIVNLSEIAVRILEELRSSEPRRDVETFVQPGVMAWGSARLLGVVLDNLLGNAWKYTSRNEKAYIEFRFIQNADSTGGTYLVKDNGAGFDMRHSELLFAPFQRLHREQEFPGTGIGLATVQRIVRRHGGDVWAEAEVGKGASFYFNLAMRPQEVDKSVEQTISATG